MIGVLHHEDTNAIGTEYAFLNNLTMAFQLALEKCSHFPEIGQFGLRMN